jgi:hypothetical protein
MKRDEKIFVWVLIYGPWITFGIIGVMVLIKLIK